MSQSTPAHNVPAVPRPAPDGAGLFVFDPDGDIEADIARLRELGPAPWVALPGGIPAHAVLHPDLLRFVAANRYVSKDANIWPLYRDGGLPPGWPLLPWINGSHAFATEGPDHQRLREPLNSALSTGKVDALMPRIQQITVDALDAAEQAAATTSTRVVDLRELVFLMVSVQVISDVLGIPDHLAAEFQGCVQRTLDTRNTPEQMLANQARMQASLENLIAYRSQHPGEHDLTSILVDGHDGRALSPGERLATIRLLIIAGFETSGNLMSSALINLLTHPDELQSLRAGRISVDDVIEETLRRNGPAAGLPLRFATQDLTTTVDTPSGREEVTFAQGEPILPIWAAAGTSPQTGDRPGEFDPARPRKEHLAFGHGAHRCPGANLALATARIVLTATLARYTDMSLATDPAQLGTLPGFIANGPATLPVKLGPPSP